MKNPIKLVCAAMAAIGISIHMTAWAADVTWTGSAGDGRWETGSNWNSGSMPTSVDHAVFPNVDTTVTITGAVQAAVIRTAGSSDATITLTGSGSLEITSDTFAQTDWTSANFVFDVDVIASPVESTRWISLYNNNLFRKGLDLSTHKLCVKANSVFALDGNANATVKYLNMNYASNRLQLSGNSSLQVLTADNDFTIKAGAELAVADNATLRCAGINIEPEADVSFTGGSIITGGSVSHANLLAANTNTVLESTYASSAASFFPFSDAVDTWTMNGGIVRNISGSSSSYGFLDMPFTNATKTIIGSGVLQLGTLFDLKTATNMTVVIDGPSLYARVYSQYDYRNRGISLQVGGGSTLGVWGNDSVTLENWSSTVVDGAFTVDTTDYSDGETGRMFKLGGLTGNGIVSVIGAGSVHFGTSSGESWAYNMPGVSVRLSDSVKATLPEGCAVYQMGDLTLTGSASLTTPHYMGRKGSSEYVRSLTMSGATSLDVKRYIAISSNATLAGNASAVIRNSNGDSPAFSCDGLSLSDNASLVVTGRLSATSLSMSGNAHLAFTAGSGFTAGADFGDGNWTMEITIPEGYEAGIHPIVRGVEFDESFGDHVTLSGATEGWSLKVLDGIPALYKATNASGIEWIGRGSTKNWSDAGNWNGGIVPTSDDRVAFGGADNLESFDDNLSSVTGLVFRSSAGPFVVTGSLDRIAITSDCVTRGDATESNAAIVSHSGFDQKITVPLDFGKANAYVLSDGGGTVEILSGFTVSDGWRYFIVNGDVAIGGKCSMGLLAFRTSDTGRPSCLRLLAGCDFELLTQSTHSFTDSSSYIGRLVIDEGASMTVNDGVCAFFYGGLENVIDGTLIVPSGSRLVSTFNEQYYVGSGKMFVSSALSGKSNAGKDHYINLGGSLKLYMGGDWKTASYGSDESPNSPTRFRMTDGTTLGATADWTYGPAADAYATISATITAADRAAVMTGTVTVNTQDPNDDAAHTITFVDPLDASAATVVKTGAGTLAFAAPLSEIGSLNVAAGSVTFDGEGSPAIGDLSVAGGASVRFASAPTLSGTLAIPSTESGFFVDELDPSADWSLLATADEITGPSGADTWKNAAGNRKFKIVADGGVKKLYGGTVRGLSIIFR